MGLHAVLGPFYDIQCRRQYRHCHPPEAQRRQQEQQQRGHPPPGLATCEGALGSCGHLLTTQGSVWLFFPGLEILSANSFSSPGIMLCPKFVRSENKKQPLLSSKARLGVFALSKHFFAWTDYLICWSADELGTAQLQKWDFSRSQGVLQLGKHQMAVSAAGNEVITQGG